MVSGLCPRPDPGTLNLIENVSFLLHTQPGWGKVPFLGVLGGTGGPSLHDLDEAPSYSCTYPHFDTGEYFLNNFKNVSFIPVLYAL